MNIHNTFGPKVGRRKHPKKWNENEIISFWLFLIGSSKKKKKKVCGSRTNTNKCGAFLFSLFCFSCFMSSHTHSKSWLGEEIKSSSCIVVAITFPSPFFSNSFSLRSVFVLFASQRIRRERSIPEKDEFRDDECDRNVVGKNRDGEFKCPIEREIEYSCRREKRRSSCSKVFRRRRKVERHRIVGKIDSATARVACRASCRLFEQKTRANCTNQLEQG